MNVTPSTSGAWLSMRATPGATTSARKVCPIIRFAFTPQSAFAMSMTSFSRRSATARGGRPRIFAPFVPSSGEYAKAPR